jgi:cytochrome c-type protein NapB
MKITTTFAAIALASLTLWSPASHAELQSLAGADPIANPLPAPKLARFINDKENIARTFEQQPPLTPHRNERYPINLKENKCLECHMKEQGKKEAKSVEMGESHFIDRAGKKHDQPAAARYFCTQCHVPQIDAEPLIGNNFSD